MDLINYIKLLCEKHGIQVDFGPFESYEYDVLFSKVKLAFLFRRLGESIKKPIEDNPHANFKVVHIWEDIWKSKRPKVESKIKSLLGITKKIHGRKTKLVKLNNEQLMAFLKANHLNTPIKAKYKYGLVFNEELVAVISFSKSRQIDRGGTTYNSYELLRFCNKLDRTVVGGFSKLLNHFIKLQDPDDIMTYVDADWSHGDFMHSLGFDYVEYKPPVEFWFNQSTGEREYPHMVLKKHGKSVDFLADENNEAQYCFKDRYIKIYNSGSYKYLLKLK